jgi:hypothetical protein
MDQAREQLFTGAALTEHEHRRRQFCDLLHEVDDVACQLARSDDELAIGLIGYLRAQRHDLSIQVLSLAGIVNQRPYGLVIEVLGRVVIGAVLHRPHGGLDLGNRGNHDDFDQSVVFFDDAQDVEAIDSR